VEKTNAIWACGQFQPLPARGKGEYIKYVLQDDKLLSVHSDAAHGGNVGQSSGSLLGWLGVAILDEQSRVTEVRNHFQPGIADGRQTIVRCLEQGNLIRRRAVGGDVPAGTSDTRI